MQPNFIGSGRRPLPLEHLDFFKFINKTSDSLSIGIHLQCGEIRKVKLDTGQDLKLLLKKEGHKVAFALTDLPVTRIDLNDGGSSDDLIISSSPWRDENHLYYKARFFSLSANLIDFGKKTYLRNYQDPDGVDGRTHNNIFNQFIDSDTIVLALESSVTDVPLG